jgi:hypothetical protein
MLRYGDVIRGAGYRAMFLAYGPPWTTEDTPHRPTQIVVILSSPYSRPSWQPGTVTRVNWMNIDGSEPPSLRVPA